MLPRAGSALAGSGRTEPERVDTERHMVAWAHRLLDRLNAAAEAQNDVIEVLQETQVIACRPQTAVELDDEADLCLAAFPALDSSR